MNEPTRAVLSTDVTSSTRADSDSSQYLLPDDVGLFQPGRNVPASCLLR
jgi:hypothetical protein